MQTQPSPNISKVERDPRLFMWLLTLVVGGMYIATLVEMPSVRQLGTLIPVTVLVVIHVILHWYLEKIAVRPLRTLWYIVLQGLLAFIISWLAGSLGMIFALFMGLLGEAVGLLGLTRRGLLAGLFYLVLLLIGLVRFSGWGASGLLMLGTLPIVIFVVIYVTLYMRQLEAREKAQALAAELESANRQLTEYAARVEDLTIANERQRMARELHDTLSQGLAGLILQLEAAQAHLALEHPGKARVIITDAMGQARLTLADARRAIDDLRRSPQDDLDSALRAQVSRFTDATGIPCELLADGIPALTDSHKEAVIRCVEEALTNVAKHAQAQSVSVNISVKDGNLVIHIKDNGRGFDESAVPVGHYGLVGIRERMRLVNGTCEIQSGVGSGTTLKLGMPL
jgi:two-component system, NarL family, sensor histidine kinase YdfH